MNYLIFQYKQLPLVVKNFVLKGFLLFSLFSVVYFLFKPSRLLDNPLTKITTCCTVAALNQFYHKGFMISPVLDGFNIFFKNENVLYIKDPCNALKLYVLYVGFLFCVPGNVIKKSVYCLIGVAIIFILNVGRCYALSWLNLNNPSLTDFAHHYIFTFVVYAIIFLLWVFFLNERKKKEVISDI